MFIGTYNLLKLKISFRKLTVQSVLLKVILEVILIVWGLKLMTSMITVMINSQVLKVF